MKFTPRIDMQMPSRPTRSSLSSHRSRASCLLVVLATVWMSGTAAAADLYLAPTGVNSGTCTSAAAPCSSISYVQSQVSVTPEADTVHFAAGSYTPDTNFLNVPNVTYVGPQAGIPAVGRTGPEASILVPSGGFAFIIQADNLVFDGLHFTSSSAAGDGSFAVYNLNPATVRNVIFVNVLTGLYAGSDIELEDSTFDTSNDAMYATGTSTVITDTYFNPAPAYAGLVSGANGPLTMTGSSFLGGTYGFLTYAGSSTVTVTGNRFSPSIPNAFYNDGSPANAENNWWGCNTGPGISGCASVVGPGAGSTDVSPRLVLTATASPDQVAINGSSTISATLRYNSEGTDTGSAPVGTSVDFTTDAGTLSVSSAPLDLLAASTTLTAPATPGTANVSAVLDGQTLAVPVTVISAPTVGFTASPTSVVLGSGSTLTWSSNYATSCASTTVSGGGSTWTNNSSLATSGSVSVTPAAVGTYTYRLTCTGPAGTTSSSAKLVVTTAPPRINSFTVSPTTINAGQSAVLKWSTSGATKCYGSSTDGSWITPVSGQVALNNATTGAMVTPAAAGTVTYTLTCTNNGGATPSNATLTIN